MATTFLDAHGQPRRPRVFLGLPTYGQISPGAMQAAYQFPTFTKDVLPASVSVSLLANGFNILWTGMLNARERIDSERFAADYFAMLHADVEPCPPTSRKAPCWLDVLIDELEANDADVMAATIPIKDDRGVTSTAVAGPEKWAPLFRLTQRQVMALPPTFGAAELGHPDKALLVNTGCWVCRVDPSWCHDFPGFTINDCIGKKAVEEEIEQKDAAGVLSRQKVQVERWTPAVEPEDWNASRWWHGRGLKVMATRRVPLAHAGAARYGNAHAWGGWASDRDLDVAEAEALSRRLGLVGVEERKAA